MLASSDGIPSWTPLKPQHSNPNHNPLANQLRCIDFLTPPTPLIIPHRLSAFLEYLMQLKNWCSIHARWPKNSLKHSIRFRGIFSKFKLEFYCILPNIGQGVTVFANGPGDLGSIPSRVIPKTKKMVLDASLLNTQHYKVWIKGKVEQSRERSSAHPCTLVANFTYLLHIVLLKCPHV